MPAPHHRAKLAPYYRAQKITGNVRFIFILSCDGLSWNLNEASKNAVIPQIFCPPVLKYLVLKSLNRHVMHIDAAAFFKRRRRRAKYSLRRLCKIISL